MIALFRSFATGPNAALLESKSEIDRLYRSNRVRVMLAITIGYGLIYTCRLALGVVKKPLIDQGIFTPAELGTIGSALFYTYAIGKLTNGFLADHANMRRFLAASFLLTALCSSANRSAPASPFSLRHAVPSQRSSSKRRSRPRSMWHASAIGGCLSAS